MTTAIISQPQHTPELMLGAKGALANGHNLSTQTQPLLNMDLSALMQPQDDPYATGRQIVASNSHLLPQPVFEPPPAPGFHAVPLGADQVEVEARSLIRTAKQSDDKYQAAMRSIPSATGKDTEWHVTHIEPMKDLINSIHGDYQKKYAAINKGATEFMRVTHTALGTISNHIEAGSDGKIGFKLYEFTKSMHEQLQKYVDCSFPEQNADKMKAFASNWPPSDAKIKPIHDFSGGYKELEFWKKKLGTGFKVEYKQSSGRIEVYPDLAPITEIYKLLQGTEARWMGSETNAQAFQSLQSGIDSQKNAIDNSVTQLLEKFRQDNTSFETLIQLLTKLVDDLLRYNMGYVQ
ncbi:IpaD/SipD/SspD family type III secretion system needle tip protein [Yersinia enterocolitica]|uniref:IpaD/SipD/SspD family type III secretion system needle tip protein n=1 Tax=Yersinia enterocolitica TaxID=630 RepID=UPI00065A8C32|nr:IpaD/SipD/SspD family type III secretion system needle tip protein [Yersinia enterocolitica]CRY18517.1 YspD [Yersinia enterocolitica]